MGPDNIKLGQGALYIDGYKLADSIQEVEEVPEGEYRPLINAFVTLGEQAAELTCTVRTTARAMARLYGTYQESLRICPNRRVVRLAQHARKHRTRKKNERRVYRILEKEADQ